jgi:hypothetical protein
MIRFKDIQIPKPCLADYESLPYDEVKRFCGSCEKHVYEFRGKDEKYFTTIFKEQKNICGIFYEDQLSDRKRSSNKSTFTPILIKTISIFLFIKSFLISHNSNAASSFPASQSEIINNDSLGVKTVYKKVTSRTRHQINIYVNNELVYESVYPVQEFIYLPDSLKPNDKIKVTVTAPHIIKTKTYRFSYSEAQTFTIKIKGRNNLRLFKRRYRIGCPSQFW